MSDVINWVLTEAYERFLPTGPEWGEDKLTNHGPMAVEVLVRRGHEEDVHGWVDAYLGRLDELPAAGDRITDANLADALGDGRRVGDWTRYFEAQVAERPWRDVLAVWWPRLLPGIMAGATHGVIRTSHAVRTLLTGGDDPAAVAELAHGLAFWAARVRAIPGTATPAGRLGATAALGSIPRIPEQRGNIAARFAQLEAMADWSPSVAALRPPDEPEDARARLAELVDAATLGYLGHGHGSPVLLVHTATAPNAVLHTLPALPTELWAPSLAAVWAASAAITAIFAPAVPAPPAEPAPLGDDPVANLLDWAVDHGDEHVIKFSDTAIEVYERTGDPAALAAARRAGELLSPTVPRS